MSRKQELKGTVLSVYIPDNSVINKIREKSAEQDRTMSSWAYVTIKNAVLGNDNVKQKEGGTSARFEPEHSTTPEPTPVVGADAGNVQL
jgi:hypothetical protein